jgi:hypothetical protein
MKLSQIFSELAIEYANRPLPLSVLINRAGSSGFGSIVGILIIPMLIPLPIPVAGFSALVGSGIILIGTQLALGYDRPYLPKFIARQKLSANAARVLLNNIDRLLQPLERTSKHRFSIFCRSWWGSRTIGICLVGNALLMSLPLPIPLTNLLPAYTILVLAIGLLELDGLFILIGYALSVATTLFFVSIAGAIWKLVTIWWDSVQSLLP